MMLLHAAIASVIVTLALTSASPCLPSGQGSESDKSMSNKITIRIGGKAFAATLSDNATAAAVRKLLPMSLTMTELNGNEKFARLSASVPTQASTPPSILTGDLMLYGSNTLVLFYESFTTTYSYTKIGQVDDPDGLKAALGPGNVDVTFELKGDEKHWINKVWVLTMRDKKTSRQAGCTRRSVLWTAVAAVAFPFVRVSSATPAGVMEIKRSGSQPSAKAPPSGSSERSSRSSNVGAYAGIVASCPAPDDTLTTRPYLARAIPGTNYLKGEVRCRCSDPAEVSV